MRSFSSISLRFWGVLIILVLAMGAMGAVAIDGLGTLRGASKGLATAVSETELDGSVRARLLGLRSEISRYAAAGDRSQRAESRAGTEDAIAQLDRAFERMAVEYAARPVDRNLTEQQDAPYRRIRALWRQGAFDGPGRAHALRAMQDESRRAGRAADTLAARDVELAEAARREADDAYDATLRRVLSMLAITILIGMAMVGWLIRSVVPRTRQYSAFAAGVSAGRHDSRLAPRGADELAELGRSLDEMVSRRESEEAYHRAQTEFVETLQVTEDEDEAHDVLRRHLERSVADSLVVVLNRNNSDDRLEPVTDIPAGSPLADGLDGASPRSCLAVRYARRHEGGPAVNPLVSCEVCGKLPEQITCDPLLVGGQVIGSVLVNHAAVLDDSENSHIRDSVAQAAPVLANLRNLALAETRAATDALTGLPNSRAATDTLRRMVAQASRTITPLVAMLVDLDHFKQINDTYGHGPGDEVLAAAADAMRGAVREADFVARYGGEEFLVLLPNTDLDGAAHVAENIRAAVASVSVAKVDRPVTASVGVAGLPEDAGDSETLLRCADRALYMAKASGRNRVELARDVGVSRSSPDAPASPPAASLR